MNSIFHDFIETFMQVYIDDCCTPKFALSFFKAFLTRFLEVQACTSTLGFSGTKIKRKLSKREKTDKNIILTKIVKIQVFFVSAPSIGLLAYFDTSLACIL